MRSPAVVYMLVWGAVIWLQSLQIIVFYEPPNTEFVLIQLSCGLILLGTGFMLSSLTVGKGQSPEEVFQISCGIDVFTRRLPRLLVAMFAIDALWSGGVPLWWVLAGSEKTHVDFGIPTFHGAFHAILLFFATSSYYLWRVGKKRRHLWNLMGFLAYGVVSFNRGIVILFLIQALFITLIMRRGFPIRSTLATLLGGAVVVLLFGWLGDVRMGGNVFSSAVASDASIIFDYVPASLIWFYVYVTGGLNNLYYNINQVSPTYLPLFTFAKMIPSVVYDALGLSQVYSSFVLADGRLTVSTAYQGLVSDYGVYGVMGYMPIIILAQVAYQKVRAGSSATILLYGMLMQTVVMTPYIDTVFYLTFFLQLILAVACAAFARRRMRLILK
jgi:oligosaccharide repeat unit polymerase